MIKAVDQLRDSLFSLLYLTPCQVCGELVESYSDGIACRECWNKQVFFIENTCVRCGLGFKDNPSHETAKERVCNLCSDFEFSVSRSCGQYSGALRVSVLYLKTHPYICSRIKTSIREMYKRSASALSADVIIPVPLHAKREKERGYNQATIVARELAKGSRLRVDAWSFTRSKETDRHRAGLDSQDRSRDMKKAFAVSRPQAIENKTVLLVDDVFTTGAT